MERKKQNRGSQIISLVGDRVGDDDDDDADDDLPITMYYSAPGKWIPNCY